MGKPMRLGAIVLAPRHDGLAHRQMDVAMHAAHHVFGGRRHFRAARRAGIAGNCAGRPEEQIDRSRKCQYEYESAHRSVLSLLNGAPAAGGRRRNCATFSGWLAPRFPARGTTKVAVAQVRRFR